MVFEFILISSQKSFNGLMEEFPADWRVPAAVAGQGSWCCSVVTGGTVGADNITWTEVIYPGYLLLPNPIDYCRGTLWEANTEVIDCNKEF